MKIFLIIITLFSTLHAFKSEKEVQIGTHVFNLVKESYNEYGDKGMTMALYVKGDTSPKLSFILKNESGACSDKDVEKGTYVIKKDSIVLYSHWIRSQNTNNTPIGDRKQVYKVDANSSFTLSDSSVYIEKTTQYEDADEGMQYLFTKPKTENEKRLLYDYISSVEEIFKAKFVMGDEADNLAFEVNAALSNIQKQQWK